MYGLVQELMVVIAYNWKNYDITPGWETNYGYELGVFGFINVGETHFNSPGTKFDQTLAHATIGVPGLNIKYYNDWFFDSPLGDGGDRYRTGAGQITKGPIKIGYYMFTGDPGLDKNDRIKDMNQGGKGGLYLTGKNGENPDEFRAGVSYIGIGPFRFGKDRERTRHELQNVLIHDKLLAKNPSPWFRPLWDRPDKWYWGFFGGGMLW
jgi:opacity protein-like surface antigen